MLGERIRARRTELRLSINTAARVAGINRNTWSAVEKGERDTEDYTYGAIERALDWRPGSIAALLNGQSPQDAPAPHVGHQPTDAEYAAAEALLRAIRDNKNRSRPLRDMADAQLRQLAAIRAADEEEQRRGVS